VTVIPDYLNVAFGEVGVKEIPGSGDETHIVAYHAACDDDDTYTADAVSWCSSFVNWCMKQAGAPRTMSRAARSWLTWGVPVDEPKIGDVCILWRVSRQSWKGHVGFWLAETPDGFVVLLGGNQGNQVKVSRYPKARVLGYRRMGRAAVDTVEV